MNENFREELKKELVKQEKHKKLLIFFGKWKTILITSWWGYCYQQYGF